MENKKPTHYSVEQAIDISKWDKYMPWESYGEKEKEREQEKEREEKPKKK